jgi:hypothetical protein
MKDRAKVIIIGATVAAAAAVPAIASAGNTNSAPTGVESTHANPVPPAATPTTASPSSQTNSDEAALESDDAAQDEAEVDVPATGTDLERASSAALEHVGEGRVTGTEVGDEESYYEIEVTLDNGRQIDVQLDEQFAVVSTEDDGSAEADD